MFVEEPTNDRQPDDLEVESNRPVFDVVDVVADEVGHNPDESFHKNQHDERIFEEAGVGFGGRRGVRMADFSVVEGFPLLRQSTILHCRLVQATELSLVPDPPSKSPPVTVLPLQENSGSKRAKATYDVDRSIWSSP